MADMSSNQDHVKSIPDLKDNAGITIVHWNARSLYSKYDEILYMLEKSECEFLCICETWLTPDITDEMIARPGYSLLRKDRDSNSGKTRGGGV